MAFENGQWTGIDAPTAPWHAPVSSIPTISVGFSSSLLSIVGSLAATYALSYVAALINKPQNQGDKINSVATLSDRLHIVRSPVMPRNIIYGEIPTSGPLVFVASKGTNNATSHLVIVLAGHEVDAIGEIMLNEDVLGTLDGTGKVTTGKYANLVVVKKHLGVPGDPADADLIAANVGWTAAHTLSGCAYLYLKLSYSATAFSNGMPNVKAVVRGKKLYDPRSTLTTWTDNWALCVRDYLLNRDGVGATAAELNESTFTTAATVSDDQIGLAIHTAEVAYDAAHSTLKLVSTPPDYALNIGDRLILSTDGTLPAGLAAGGAYYLSATAFGAGPHFYLSTTVGNAAAGINVIVSGAGSGTHNAHVGSAQGFTPVAGSTTRLSKIAPAVTTPASAVIDLRTGDQVQFSKWGTVTSSLINGVDYFAIRHNSSDVSLASSLANALAGTALTHGLTIGSGGRVCLARVSQRRYTCNGTVETSATPRSILTDLLTGGLGMLTNSGGAYGLLAGIWRSPTASGLNENDLRGTMVANVHTPRRELFNAVRGTYADPEKAWQPGDFAPVRNPVYKTEDGDEEIWRDIKLNYTTNPQEAQRIAKAHLEASRQSIALTFPAKFTAFKFVVGDIVPVSIAYLGWVNKPFQVMSWELPGGGGVDLTLREVASTIWDWSYGDATHIDPAPNSDLPDMSVLDAPLELAVESGDTTLLTTGDGSIISRLKASWVAVDNAFLGGYEVEYKKSTDTVWQSSPAVGSETMTFLSFIEDGLAYDVRVRAVSIFPGVFSLWTELLGHNAAGKGIAPADVSGFHIQQSGASVMFGWNHSVDSDLAGYEIRFNPVGNHRWEDATPLTRVTKGTQITTIKTPPDTWNFMIKARDNSGLYSTNAAEVVYAVQSDFLVIGRREELYGWEQGTLSNFLIHGNRALVPMSTETAYNAAWATFDQAVYSPFPLCSYESPPIDIGQDGQVRVYGAPISALLPGAVGVADPKLVVDYRTDAGSFSGFDAWQIGFVTGRYFKFKTSLSTGDGVACIRSQKETVDADKRSESGANLAVPAGGVTVTFAKPFFSQPTITPSLVSTTAGSVAITAQSAVDATFKVFNTAGTAIAGVINWKAEGI